MDSPAATGGDPAGGAAGAGPAVSAGHATGAGAAGGTSVDAILTWELEDVCAYGDELAAAMPELGMALAWPG
ncbi:MAG TPA: hypothetical protein VLC46_01755 [Thermoanaerobaculia bacterium]|nr:hypothetical protein [Thermoanaerobaculia bacterium]